MNAIKHKQYLRKNFAKSLISSVNATKGMFLKDLDIEVAGQKRGLISSRYFINPLNLQIMKRKVMISGDFTLDEVQDEKSNATSGGIVIKSKKASDRIEALKAAGIDVSNLFAMGDEMLVRVVDGVPSQVSDDDPIFNSIVSVGTIPDRRLFRRWVMSQMFHILRSMGPYRERTFVDVVQDFGYEYQWKMLEEELRVQAKLAKEDGENFQERNRWFNEKVVAGMMKDYIEKLHKYVDGLKVKHCKGVPYKTIKGTDIFCVDINAKVFCPLNNLIDKLDSIHGDAKGLYFNVRSFNQNRVRLAHGTNQSKAFIDAYKGSGAFYTMKNLILFHGCKFRNKGKFMSKDASMAKLHIEASSNEGWQMLGVMKKLIEDNGISINGKLEEWKKAKKSKKRK